MFGKEGKKKKFEFKMMINNNDNENNLEKSTFVMYFFGNDFMINITLHFIIQYLCTYYILQIVCPPRSVLVWLERPFKLSQKKTQNLDSFDSILN